MARNGLLILLVLGVLEQQVVAEPLEPLLKKGEVWVITSNSKKVQISKTDGKIDKINVSPSSRYVAAHKIIGYFPTSFKSKPVYSVLIIDLNSHKVIADLKVQEELMHPLGWRPDDTYQFGEGSLLDIHTTSLLSNC